jgi:hypothetical protein
MRLTTYDVREIPAPAALRDSNGIILEGSQTPEWNGIGPGALSFLYGQSNIVLGPDGEFPEVHFLIDTLLNELRNTGTEKGGIFKLRLDMLAASLELVAGYPINSPGNLSDVFEYAKSGITARTQLEITSSGNWKGDLLGGGAPSIALALVQLAVNAEVHARARKIDINASHGPTFTLTWEDSSAQKFLEGSSIQTSRSVERRKRWGMGYARHAVDALGGVVTDPRSPTEGIRTVGLGLGTGRLTLPLALVQNGQLDQYTASWEEEQRIRKGMPIPVELQEIISLAKANQGTIVGTSFLHARDTGKKTWLMIPPNTTPQRAKEITLGIAHEKALWSSLEPHSSKIHSLAAILLRVLGTPWDSCAPMTWNEDFPLYCEYFQINSTANFSRYAFPDPRITAFLLSELDGTLNEAHDSLFIKIGTSQLQNPLGFLLEAKNGLIRLI